MAKRSLGNEKDINAVNDAMQGNQKNIIKLDKKTYIRLLSKDFVSEYVHPVLIKGVFHPMVCLGGFEKKGYAPDDCPACAKAKKIWGSRKELQSKTKKESEFINLTKKGKALQTQMRTVMAALKGSISNEEDENGDIKAVVVFEKEAKILPITSSQWTKLTQTIFEDYDYMESIEDLLNRNLIFEKKEKKSKSNDNKKGNDYTEVEIKPSKKKTKAPKFENELPDLEENFEYVSKKEMIQLLKEMEAQEEDLEDDPDLEEEFEEEEKPKKVKTKKSKKEVDEDDLEDEVEEEEEEKPKSKKSKKTSSKTKVKNNYDDEDPDFIKDDEDLEEDSDEDDDYDDFEEDEE